MCSPNMLDRLVLLFDKMAQMVTTSTNSRAEESVGADDNSVMGFFLRRCWCDFTMLSFEALCTLAMACERYSMDYNAKELNRQLAPGAAIGKNLGTFRTSAATDRALAHALSDAESNWAVVPPQDLIAAVIDLEESVPGGIPGSHLVCSVVATKRREPVETVERVHLFAGSTPDPCVSYIGMIATAEAPPPTKDGGGKLQASAVMLAASLARLGQAGPAMKALNEAMRAAQQAGDDSCLAHALAVLCQVMETATPGTTELQAGGPSAASPGEAHISELLLLQNRCFDRSETLGLPHLAAYARLALARHALLFPAGTSRHEELGLTGVKAAVGVAFSGEDDANADVALAIISNLPPTTPCRSAQQAAEAQCYLGHLHAACALSAAVPLCPPSSTAMACIRILKGLPDYFSPMPDVFGPGVRGQQRTVSEEVGRLTGASLLMRGAAWEVHGSKRLAQASVISFLRSQGPRASGDHVAVGYAHLAMSLVDTYGFAAAERVLKLANLRLPHSNSFALRAARLSVAHRRACHRADVRHAMTYAGSLVGLADPSDRTRIGYRIEGEEAFARAYLAGQYYAEAEKAARKVFDIAVSAHHPLAALRLLLLIGRIHLEGGSWSTAMPYIVSTIAQYRDMHADVVGAEAALLFSIMLRRMGRERLSDAHLELQAAMPIILAHGGLDLQGRARLAMAETLIEMSSEDAQSLGSRASLVLSLLTQAFRDFEKLDDWRQAAHCADLSGEVYCAVGDLVSRETAAARVLKLRKLRADGFR